MSYEYVPSDVKFRKFEVEGISFFDKFKSFPEAVASKQDGDRTVYKICRKIPYKDGFVYLQDYGFENLKSVMGCSIDSEEVIKYLKDLK